MKNKIKNNKGFTTIDIVIAVIILSIFVPVVTSLISSIGTTTASVERKAKAVNYATQYLEYAKMETTTLDASSLKNRISLDSGYTADITIENNADSTQKVTVDIKYNVGNETKTVSLYINI